MEMAESKKSDSSSVNLKEKHSLLDLDIGKDFLSSWKSVSVAEGNEMDFDLTPVSKGNKKSFDFGKVDMDFNLDGDFGKLSSFNIDMPDLDISPPLKKDGKSMEKSKESSSGKNKGKSDRFAFAFDFDELENFNFESSLTKESSEAHREQKSTDNSPNENRDEDNEGFMHMDLIGNMSTLEEGTQKPSLPETEYTFDMDLVGGSKDVEPSKKNCPSDLPVNDSVTPEKSAAREFASDKGKGPLETVIASSELPRISQSEKLASLELFDHETCTENDARLDFSSENLSNNELSRSPGPHDKVDCNNANVTGSNIKQDVHVSSISDSTGKEKHTMSENPEHLQLDVVTEKNNCDKSETGVKDHVMDNRESMELGQVNSIVEKCCTKEAASGMLYNTPSAWENQETTSEILKLPLISQPDVLSEKETVNGREPRANCSRFFIQSEKPECPVQKAPTQRTFSSSVKMGFIQPSIAEGRESDSIQNDKVLALFPLQHSNTLLKRDIHQIRSQESCKGLKICGEVNTDGLQNGKQLRDSSTTQNKDVIKTKAALSQGETSTKNVDTCSMVINNEKAQKCRNPTTFASISTIKNTPANEQKLPSIESRRENPELRIMKLSGLSLDSIKSPIWKDLKSPGNISQNKVLLRKTPSDIAHFPDSQKQVSCTLSMKRKALEKDAADTVALHPFKRLSHPMMASRNSLETSEKVTNKQVHNHNNGENDCTGSRVRNYPVSTFHVPDEVQIKAAEVSFSIENDSNIKQTEAYSKELDHLCNMLRKKNDEAKDILVQAIVNSNKLLLLNNPTFEQKIRAARKFFARLTLNSTHG